MRKRKKGYDEYEHSDNYNSSNDKKQKQIRSKYGEMTINVPHDLDITFEPQVVKKTTKEYISYLYYKCYRRS